jgi:selenocysteine-specific elongation factor
VIVATQARRHPRRRAAVLEDLDRRSGGSPADALLATIAAGQPVEPDVLIRASELGHELAAIALQELLTDGRAVEVRESDGAAFVMTSDAYERIGRRATEELDAYHRQNALRQGMPREELRSRIEAHPRVYPALLRRLIGDGLVAESGPTVARPGWVPRLDAGRQAEADAYLATLRSNPYAPPVESRPPDDMIAFLQKQGLVVDVDGGIVFEADAYHEMVGRIVAKTREDGTITLASVRDLFGTSRRYAQALLEHLDQLKVTLRRGDERVLGRAAEVEAQR